MLPDSVPSNTIYFSKGSPALIDSIPPNGIISFLLLEV